MEMMKLAAQLENKGRTIYHLEVGQPTVSAPQVVYDAAIEALKQGRLDYCPALGLTELREAIAQHYQHFYGLTIDPDCVVITPGASFALYIALLLNFKQGANIAIAVPSYPCYRNVIESLGLNVIELQTDQACEYLLHPEELASSGQNIDGILLASPNNPTGSLYDYDAWKSLSDYCRSNNIKILSDEIYHGITFERPAFTAKSFSEEAIVINGFSKYFAMTGWRVGWLLIDKQAIRQYENLLQNILLCTSPLNQIAAIKAFSTYEELDKNVQVYRNNRDKLYHALIHCGFSCFKPKGGFYLYLELNDFASNSMMLCEKIIHETGIALAPGLDFDSN